MNITELKELRQRLEDTIDFCPPDDAPLQAFESAEKRAFSAGERYQKLAPVFALLDAIDFLYTLITCGGCGNPVAWTCPACGCGNTGAPNVQAKHLD